MLYLQWLETSRLNAGRPAIHHGGKVVTFRELASAAAAAPKAMGPVIARSGGISFFVEILRAWRDGQAAIPVEADAPEPVLKRPPPEETRLVKYTPGASGVPRGIFLSGPQLAADAQHLVAAMGLGPETPNLGVISMAHSYGFSNIVLPLLLHGVPVHLVPVPFPRVVEEVLGRERGMIVPAVPSMWRAWLRSGILKDAPIRLAISAGAPLSLELEQAVFRECGTKIHNFYGASECGGIAWDATEIPRESGDLLGTPLPGVKVETDAEGRFRVMSPAVGLGYDSPRDDDELGSGVYLTRDLGYFDESGALYLRGTLGGAINVAGRKVSPAKVESALLATGLLERVTVRGVPSSDPERHEEISAVVELRPGVTLDELKSAASARLQSWELPRHWR